jgi:hypothetical protein
VLIKTGPSPDLNRSETLAKDFVSIVDDDKSFGVNFLDESFKFSQLLTMNYYDDHFTLPVEE